MEETYIIYQRNYQENSKAWFPLGDKGDNCDTIVAYRTYRIVGTFSYRPYRITIALIGLIAIFGISKIFDIYRIAIRNFKGCRRLMRS